MEKNQKRLKRTTQDRISDLPVSVLLQILSMLNMKEVVKTSVLSKKWEYIWTKVPTLTFEYTPQVVTPELPSRYTEYSYKYALELKEKRYKEKIEPFVKWVNKTLLRCKHTTIKKMHIKFYYMSNFAGDVNIWVKFAAQNKLEDMNLQLEGCHVYNLPRSLCQNSSLLNLSISHCNVARNIDFCWTSLKSLTITHVTLHDDTLSEILFGSPMLEFLKISNCQSKNGLYINSESLRELVIDTCIGGHLIEISAPNIQSFHIFGELFKGPLRICSSSLFRAELNCPFDYDGDSDDENYEKKRRHNYKTVIESIRTVVQLEVGFCFVQTLLLLGEKDLSSPFSNLTCVKVSGLIDETDVVGIICLLKCSPNLEKLVVNKEHSDKYIRRHWPTCLLRKLAKKYWESEKRSEKFVLPHLKTVKLKGFEEFDKYTRTLVQFLLKNAVLLENIVMDIGGFPTIVTPRLE